MKVIAARCQVCGKSYLVTDVNKDFNNILKNPKYPFHCETCGIRIQSEARQQKYYQVFHPERSA